MRVRLSTIFVDDQEKALKFYTSTLGFLKSRDIPVAGPYRWLTLKSPEGGDAELSLEPNANPIAKAYQDGLLSQAIPANAFEVDHIESEVGRLKRAGVQFKSDVTSAGPVKIAVFFDTCGNLIQIYEAARES